MHGMHQYDCLKVKISKETSPRYIEQSTYKRHENKQTL